MPRGSINGVIPNGIHTLSSEAELALLSVEAERVGAGVVLVVRGGTSGGTGGRTTTGGTGGAVCSTTEGASTEVTTGGSTTGGSPRGVTREGASVVPSLGATDSAGGVTQRSRSPWALSNSVSSCSNACHNKARRH